MKVHSRRLILLSRPVENACSQSLCRKNGQELVLCVKNRASCGQGEVFKQSISKLIHWHPGIEELQADSPEMSSALRVL